MKTHFTLKIKNPTELLDLVSSWKASKQKIVFTNGCFDILHVGHVSYLAEAKSKGDKLIVAINEDNSVKRLKGPTRPINSTHDRMSVLAALESVDAVISFEEDTPFKLISSLLPDILVKGGDWKAEQIIGSDIVLANGGAVYSLQFVDGKSTTNIIEKIKE
ncbi:MAG: D-glycero-beta-D-manno-heptose 1-phosphate adenylyltransferase [Saprospiraceae bacterium]|nr:D-glycero-beta-D-manno-heptose 1-phosphate adenylyltransferase [Saprospiraceae bacterium]